MTAATISRQRAQAHRHTKRRNLKLRQNVFVALLLVPVLIVLILAVSSFMKRGDGSEPPAIQPPPAANGTTRLDGDLPQTPANSLASTDSEAQTDAAAEEILPRYTEAEVIMIAQTVWGEARGIKSDMEKAAVIWCILNRVDSPRYPNTIEAVVKQRMQFQGYNPDHPVDRSLKELTEDVLNRWFDEKDGAENVGRVLPSGYMFFEGDGKHNHYTTEFLGSDYWDWSLPNPYAN